MWHHARALKAPVDEKQGKIALSSDCLTIDGLVTICFAIRVSVQNFTNFIKMLQIFGKSNLKHCVEPRVAAIKRCFPRA